MKNYRIITGPESIQGSPEWHKFRKGKIGASMAGAIMGVSPFSTALQLWEEIQFNIERPKNEAMRRGSSMEEEARIWVNNHMAFGKHYSPMVVQRLDHPQIISSLDGYLEDQDGNPHILEIKCGGMRLHEEALDGRIPIYYLYQMYHQMDSVGLNKMTYVSYYQGKGVLIDVQKDEKVCKRILQEELSFIESLINFDAPKSTDKDWVSITDEDSVKKMRTYNSLSEKIKCLEEMRDTVRQEILNNVHHRRIMIEKSKIQKVEKRGAIDYSKIPELNGVDTEPYRKQTVSIWRIVSE